MRPARNARLSSSWHKSGIALALGVFATALCGPAAAKTVRFDVGDFGYTWPLAINASRAIVGYYVEFENGNYVTHAFLRTDNKITNVDVDGAACGTWAVSINRRGTVAGYECGSDSVAHGFVRSSKGKFTIIDAPGAADTSALGINDTGTITGFYHDSGGAAHGFVRAADGTITRFDPEGAENTEPTAINNAGAIAGSYKDESGIWHCFLRAADGTFTTFDVPNKDKASIHVSGMNDAGEIVGTSWTNAFLRQADGTVVELGPDGENSDYSASAINNNGDVIGDYQDEWGVHGFVRHADGRTKVLDRKDTLDTFVNGINDSGDIAGTIYDEHQRPGSRGDIFYIRGFLRTK